MTVSNLNPNQKLIQQLHRAIERRTELEAKWAVAHLGSQLPEHRAVMEALFKSRKRVGNLLEKLWKSCTWTPGP